nr:immunoglobulin light chain junction region [Macaca mulatta]MOW70197.1 immunoglobulin light chain junction region [Macaca mulatta]MOW70283.1 immunoglobulin light chain junction region [Macaca mulatta]MOW71581.1 immunoglobulin light chain junction region [Macaca mulatta]
EYYCQVWDSTSDYARVF